MRDNDIVFFNLHRKYLNRNADYGGFLGIFLLAAFLNSNGYDSQSFAGPFMEGKGYIDELCSKGKVSMIGLYCDFENVTENVYLSRYIKDTYGLPVIVGGPQATALDEEFYRNSQCDAIVRYEGELTVLELANCLLDGTGSLSEIRGISYLLNDSIVVNEERPLIENLDNLPYVNDECYLLPEKREKSLSIMTGRGCPFNCAFCHEGAHTKRVRLRSVQSIINEIEKYLQEHKGQRELFIMFTDDTFTLIPDRVKQICEALQSFQKTIPIRWFCEAHIHTLYKHPEMIEYLAAAKCQRVQLGIEAGTQRVLDAFRKGSTLNEIKEVVRICEKNNIQQLYSNIILGAAFFSQETFEYDMAFAKELLLIGKGIMELGAVSYWPLPETSITVNPAFYETCIADYEFITSVGDYAQVYTNQFSTWDISKLVLRFDNEMLEFKKKMFNEHIVPKERIKEWFDGSRFGRSYGRWWHALKDMPHIFSFYEMLASGEGVTSNELTLEEFYASHPMRMCDISHSLNIENQDVTLLDIPFDEIDKVLFPYCTGKLSVKEISVRLKEKMNILGDGLLSELREKLLMYEEKYLIVFSRI